MNEQLLALSKTLKSRGFQVEVCENIEQAAELVHEIIGKSTPVSSIGFGNSITVQSAGLQESLSKFTKEIYIHIPVGTEDIDRKALTADFYLTSANAVSLDGHIINIDGNGNRTAATCFGPEHVIYLIGKNKITKTLEEAMLRAKNAAVQNAKRYNRKTPCVQSGKCQNCISPECVCSVTTIHRKKPFGVNITVILINEDAGL
jgi:L-lactate utilization protein LutB